jgi:transposase
MSETVDSETVAYVAHYYPLLGQLMHQMGLPDAVNEVVGVPPQGQDVDTGTFVAGMIINILAEAPIRMYRLASFFSDKPMPLLFPGQPDLPAEKFDDARAGRVLDALWQANPQKVLSAVVRQVIQCYQPERHQLHVDTTSKSFYGAYANQSDPLVPQITYGRSKDLRPDLKQLIFGVGRTEDGLLLLGDVGSGNQSDMTFNGHWIQHVREQLALGADEFLLYVADSAVVTTGNLERLREYKMDLLSRLPERFGLAEALMIQAQVAQPETWEDLGVLREGQGKGAASYQVWQTEAELAGANYRFLVVASSTLDKRHVKALERALGREVKAYEKLAKQVAAQSFSEPSAAETELNYILRSWSAAYHQLEGEIESFEQRLPRSRRGRPRAGEVPPTATYYRLRLTLVPDETAQQKARDRCGMFVLITSLLNRHQYPARRLLDTYKGQHTAEQALRFIKSPAWVGAFCLKKPHRVAAFGYVVLLAAIVYTLLERQVRQALAKPGQPALRGLNNAPTRQPTAYAIQVILSPILVLEEVIDGQPRFRLNRPLSENQRRVLHLAGFSEAIYHSIGPAENSSTVIQAT